MLEIEIYTTPGHVLNVFSRIEVDGCTDSMVIADKFSNYFQKIYTSRNSTQAEN